MENKLSQSKKSYSRKDITTFILILDILGVFTLSNFSYFLVLSHLSENIIFSWKVLLIGTINMFFLYIFDTYQFNNHEHKLSAPIRSSTAILTASCLLAIIIYLLPPHTRGGFLGRGVFSATILSLTVWTFLTRTFFLSLQKTIDQNTNWLIIGIPEALEAFQTDLKNSKLNGQIYYHNILLTPFSNEDEIAEIILKKRITAIVLASPNQYSENIINSLLKIKLSGIKVFSLTEFYEIYWMKVPIYYIKHKWFLLSSGFTLLHNMISFRIKRVFDIFLSFFLLPIFIVIFPFLAVAIKMSSQGPIFFKQKRVGKHGRIFTIYKFRSMPIDAEETGAQWTEPKDPRVTFIGKIIRKTRLDEIPQALNVLKGDMSFIGPRPERPEFTNELQKKIPYYDLRHLIKPGITGWAQVSYHYGSSIEDAKEKLEYDLFYIKNHSIILDLKIILKTIRIILFGRGQ